MPRPAAQEVAEQCPAKALGLDRAHRWDQAARECRALEVPEPRGHVVPAEHRGQVARAEQLGQGVGWEVPENQGAVPAEHRGRAALEEGQVAAPVEHQALAALEGGQAGTKRQYGNLGCGFPVHIPIPNQ